LKVKKSGYRETFPPIKMDVQDAIQIIQLLKSICKNVSIDTDKYEIEDENELLSLSEDIIYNLSVTAFSPYISLECLSHDIRLSISEDTVINRGLFEKIKGILHHSRMRSWKIIDRVYLAGGVFVAALSTAINITKKYIANHTLELIPVTTTVFFLLFSILWIIYYFVIGFTKHTRIIVNKEKAHNSFWKRKKDDIYLSIITGIIGLIVGYFIARIS
jgi:hypothetical protein